MWMMRYEVTMNDGVTKYEDRETMVWMLARMIRKAESVQGVVFGKVQERDGGAWVTVSLGGKLDDLVVYSRGVRIQKRALQQLIHDVLERKGELATKIKVRELQEKMDEAGIVTGPESAAAVIQRATDALNAPESPALATEPAKGPDTQAPAPEAKEGVPPAPEKAVPNPEEVVLNLLESVKNLPITLDEIWHHLAENHTAYWTKARTYALMERMLISGAVKRNLDLNFYTKCVDVTFEPVLA
jgi:hypothetical protein